MAATSASVTLSSNFPYRSLKIQIANIDGSADDVITGLLKCSAMARASGTEKTLLRSAETGAFHPTVAINRNSTMTAGSYGSYSFRFLIGWLDLPRSY